MADDLELLNNAEPEPEPERPVKPYETPYNIVEVPGSRQLRINAKGITGSWTARGFKYEWAEKGVPVEPDPEDTENTETQRVPILGCLLPAIQSSWSEEYFYCLLKDVQYRELENGMGEATLNYTSEGFTQDIKATISNTEETYTVSQCAKWEVTNQPNTGSIVSNPIIEEYDWRLPNIEYQITWHNTYAESNHYSLYNYINYAKQISAGYKMLNSGTWHTFAPETMLLDRLDIEPEFTYSGYLIGITVNCVFLIRGGGLSHNYEWKKGVPLKTSGGNDIHWHNIPNAGYPFNLFYTTDIYKIGSKIYPEDLSITPNSDGSITVVPVSPTPFHGGWYKPYYYIPPASVTDQSQHKFYKYGTCNFTQVLGIPDITVPNPGINEPT